MSQASLPSNPQVPGLAIHVDSHAHVVDVNVFGKDQLQACYLALAMNLVKQKRCRELSLCSATHTLGLLMQNLDCIAHMECWHRLIKLSTLIRLRLALHECQHWQGQAVHRKLLTQLVPCCLALTICRVDAQDHSLLSCLLFDTAMCFAGLMAYMRSGASSLFVDTLTVSKLAVVSAFTRFGRLIPRSKPKAGSGDETAACGHGGLAAEQSARLANGDGLLAEDDAYLISGELPSMGTMTNSPGDSPAGVSHGKGKGSTPPDVPMHIEMGSEPQQDMPQSSAAAAAAALASADSSSMSSESLSNKMVTAVMLDKRLASLGTGSTTVSRELMQATQDMHTDTDRHNIVKDASQQVNNLGMAAIAVNEAEVSLGEVKVNGGGEVVPGPLAPGVSLPEHVIDDSIPGDSQDVQGAGSSLGPDDIPAKEGAYPYCTILTRCQSISAITAAKY